MRIYLASKYENKPLIKIVKRILENNGYEVVSRWVDSSNRSASKGAREDLKDIINSDIVIGFEPLGKGSSVELALGICYGKEVYLVTENESNSSQLPFIAGILQEYKNGHIITAQEFYKNFIDLKE